MSATHIASPSSGATPNSGSIMSHFIEWVPRRSMISSKSNMRLPPLAARHPAVAP